MRVLRENWNQLYRFLPRRSILTIAVIGLFSFIGGLAESAVLVLLTLSADGLIRGATAVHVAGITLTGGDGFILALLMIVVRLITIVGAAVMTAQFAASVTMETQRQVMTFFVNSTYVTRSTRPLGDLGTVVVSHARFTGELSGGFTVAAASLCGLMAFGGTSLMVNPGATVAIAVLGSAILGLMRPLRGRSRMASEDLADATRALAQEVTEVELLQREIELFQVGEQALGRVDRPVRSVFKSLREVTALSVAIPQLFQTAILAGAVVSLILVADRVDGANLASAGAVILLLIRSISSAQQYVTANQRIIDQGSYVTGVNDLLSELSLVHRRPGKERPPSLTPLRLEDVNFTYDGESDVLTSIDIEFDCGQVVGIVGPSGAGKSTLVEILLRLRQPTSGRILGGGAAWSQIDPDDFAHRVAFVPQQAVLIKGSVSENIDLYRGIGEDRIVKAIKDAHLEREIAALPDGIHTQLGPDDRVLSGGQRQRLTIARALAGDPEILILDEPTSALDAISERAISQTLDTMAQRRLVIVVAHRFSTLRTCSRIIALDDGMIEVDASPQDVIQHSDFFRIMVDEGHEPSGGPSLE